MKTGILCLLMSFALPAYSAISIDISANVAVTKADDGNAVLTIAGAPADQLFTILSKTASGISCSASEGGAQCVLSFQAVSGVRGVVAQGSPLFVLNLMGASAENVYQSLASSAESMDAEASTFQKVVPGIYCQEQIRWGYNCLIYIDPARGVLK